MRKQTSFFIVLLSVLLYCLTLSSCGKAKHPEELLYSKSVTLLISEEGATDKDSLSSSDIALPNRLSQKLNDLLLSDQVNDPVRKEFPDFVYILSLEQEDGTSIIKITITANQEEGLATLCNKIAMNFRDQLPIATPGYTCTIVDFAK